jgi:soluble lytic murein transglycosylase-like protein
MGRTAYRREIEIAAQKYGLPSDLVEAQCVIESGGYTDAFRYEAGFFSAYMAGKPEWAFTFGNPRRYSASYGLQQCLFVVAVEMGFPKGDPPERLFIPEVGLEFGCKKLADLMLWAHRDTFQADAETRLRSALAAYNGGKARNVPDLEPDRNAGYADRVMKIYARPR